MIFVVEKIKNGTLRVKYCGKHTIKRKKKLSTDTKFIDFSEKLDFVLRRNDHFSEKPIISTVYAEFFS